MISPHTHVLSSTSYCCTLPAAAPGVWQLRSHGATVRAGIGSHTARPQQPQHWHLQNHHGTPIASPLVTAAAAAGAAASSSGPLLLHLPAGVPVRALDVEYTTLLLSDGSQQQAPTWVCVVDEAGRPLLKSYIHPPIPEAARTVGGVKFADFFGSPTLPDTTAQLQQLMHGCLLIGHGLRNDLASLGYSHPPDFMYDTMDYPGFVNKGGSARSLKRLAAQHLGWDIQSGAPWTGTPRQLPSPGTGQSLTAGKHTAQRTRAGRRQARQPRHDPEEDAAAVMALFKCVVWPSSYHGLVESTTQQLLADMQRVQQEAETMAPPTS